MSVSPEKRDCLDRLLCEYVRTGDRNLLDLLVEGYEPLVRHVAIRFVGRGESLEDLIQVGTIGLIEAIYRFDPNRHIRLITYAVPYIRGYIKRHFRDYGYTISIPRVAQELGLKVRRRSIETGEAYGAEWVSLEYGVSLNAARDALLAIKAMFPVSLSMPTDEAGTPLEELIASTQESAEDRIETSDLRDAIHALGGRCRRVIELIFFEERSQTETSRIVGCSQMHVSRLHAKALTCLRQIMSGDFNPDKCKECARRSAAFGQPRQTEITAQS